MGRIRYCLCLLVASPLLFLTQTSFSQEIVSNELRNTKNGISKPVTLPTNPLGLLFYRVPHNFKIHADSKSSLDINLSSGNVWGQQVTTFIPTDPSDRQRLENITFYDRIFDFDTINSPYESFSLGYDGVIKDLRVQLSIPLGRKYEISVSARSFYLTDGTFALDIFTSDEFIEGFHTNGLGGEDPFGRRLLGLGKAGISYTDRDGRQLEISNGDFVFSGIETAGYYYMDNFASRQIYLNLGMHLGANVSEYNQSMDLGLSLAGVKDFVLKNNNHFYLGLGLNLLRKGMITFSDDQTDLGTSDLFGSFEGHIEYSIGNRKGANHSFGINYHIQTSYNEKSEEQYYVPFDPDRIKRWHEASRQLYKFPSFWSLIYSFTKKIEFSVYLQQDMLVNNTPDIQTGMRIKIPI